MQNKRRFFLSLITAIIIIFLGWGTGSAQDAKLLKQITGSWTGSMKFQSMELRIVFNFSLNDKDSLTVTIDSPDQNANNLPTSFVNVTSDSVLVRSSMLKAEFKGRFNDSLTVISGKWSQSVFTLPLELRYRKGFTGYKRSQEPAKPYPYREEEVVIKNTEAGVNLSGTLTTPFGDGPFAAVILVTGSGAQDRNEAVFGHQPFLVLSDHLTRNGIAVLRYDDRGFAKSTGTFATATTFDFASDASSALDFLLQHPGIDTKRIGILGHSEGGLVAPIVASERPEVSFIILLAGPGIPGEKLLQEQSKLLAESSGANPDVVKESLKLNEQVYSVLKKNKDDAKAQEKIIRLLSDYNKKQAKERKFDEVPQSQIEAQAKSLVSPWFRTFLTLDPVEYLSKVKCPVLALNGELDQQVPPQENLNAIESALIFGGNPDYTIDQVTGVNHLFQTATTGSPTEYSKIEETMSPFVLEMISNWIKKTLNLK